MIMEIGIGIITFGTGLFIGTIIQKIKDGTNKGNDGLFTTIVNNLKEKAEQKKAEKAFRKQIQNNARAQALREMQPELVAHMKQQEMKKLTGEDKKEKLQKFANAFSMNGQFGQGQGQSQGQGQGQGQGMFNTNDKINKMLGINQTPVQAPVQEYIKQEEPVYSNSLHQSLLQQQQQQKYQEQIYSQPKKRKSKSKFKSRNDITKPVQHKEPVKQEQSYVKPQPAVPVSDPFSSDKINMMLGRNVNGQKKQSNNNSKEKTQSEEERILSFLK